MKTETFFEKFDLFADAPDAVAKMRALLVDFAVSGKLVPNDPQEKPVTLPLSEQSPDDQQVPSNWRCGLLGDAFTFEYGDNLPAQKRTETGHYPVYGSNGVVGTHDTYLTKEPAIIVGRKGSAGALNIANGPSWTTDVAYFVRPPKDVDLRFTYYLFSTLRLDELGKGIKPGLSRKEAYSLAIALPPLAEQRRIVAKVDELMALCDRLEEQQQELETRQAALTRASLTRFADAPTPANLDFLFHKSYAVPPAELRKSILTLAVQGKLVPQDPNDEPADNLCEPDDELAAAATFEVPNGWTWARLAKLADVNGGFAFKSTAYTEDGTRVIRISDFDEFGFKDHKVVRHPFTPDLQKFALAESNILMAMTGGTVGKSHFVRSLPEPMVVNQRVATIKVLEGATPSYIDIVIRSEITQEVIRKAKNSTNDNISMSDIKGFAVPLPPLAEQRRIVEKVDELMAFVDALETQLATARSTAEALLTAAVAELTNAKERHVAAEV